MRVILISALLLSACAAAKLPENVPATERKNPVAVEAKFAGNEVGAQYTAQVKFAKGQASISAKERQEVQKAEAKAAANGKIKNLLVVAWADEESASLKKGNANPKSIALADRRLKSLEAVASGKGLKIEKVNMAQSPTALGRFFSSDDFRVKQALEAAGVKSADQKGSVSFAGKGLVLIVLEGAK